MSWNYPDGCGPDDYEKWCGPDPDEYDPYEVILEIAHDARNAGKTKVIRKDILAWTAKHGADELYDWIEQDEEASALYEMYRETKDLTVLDLCLDRVAEAVTEEI